MPKILFIASHRKERAPGQRFRFEQYLNHLTENGFECDLSYLVSKKDDSKIYNKSNYIYKFYFFLKAYFLRIKDLSKIKNYDIIFIFREALMSRSLFFEKKAFKTSTKIIFDFDDSIWLENVSKANKLFKWLKNPNKTKKIISLSNLIFSGNQYLSNYASRFNKNTVIIPTTIDTDIYQNNFNYNNNKIIIGWSGSITTIQHFEYALPYLKKIFDKYESIIEIKVIGDGSYINEYLKINGLPWCKETEIKDLCSFDIGIMPLPNNEWSMGKCGLKGLQYMALGIPTIMSAVGVNNEIIKDGENGFLAKNNDDFEIKLEMLIKSKKLRLHLGENGKKTIEEKYSVNAWKSKYLEYFNNLINEKNSTLQ